jgi:pSer/pThr/pTyr-binding forkhead associated (FHA) protein
MPDKNTSVNGKDREGGIPPGLVVELDFTSGPDQGMVKKLTKRETVLGRSDSDIIISDRAASKQHAKICYENKDIVVRDLGSTNGTFLNGGRVWEAVLGDKDELTIGETVIRVSIGERTEAVKPAAEAGAEEKPELPVVEVESLPGTETTRPRPARFAGDPLEGPLPEGVRAALQVASGPDAGMRFDLTNKATVLGRAGADLVLNDIDVSRKHASIEFIARDKIILKDLRSRNGTFINQRRITVANLRHGDSIQIGRTTLNFFISMRS